MSLDPITAVLNLGKEAIHKIWPDANKRAEELRKLEALRLGGDLKRLEFEVQLLLKQAEINLADAKSASLWQSGWRPSVGWVCAASLALMYIPKAVVMTALWSWQSYEVIATAENVARVSLPVFPDLGVADIIALLGALLGVGAMRSFDKNRGIDTK
ncbi:3TM-type holin [Marinagarivorans algicola]|uniref:3TM-type holin n=1 Tax=Marinagarivorans algicola TaxID=1513270 RepID=UPI003736CFED